MLFLDGLLSLVAQQIRNFAAANILNLFLLAPMARALIFNLSEARLGEAAQARGDHGQSWGLQARPGALF